MNSAGRIIASRIQAQMVATDSFGANKKQERWARRTDAFSPKALKDQITEPSLWIATHASIFFPTLIGSTLQYMMKGVPSFL